MSILRERSMALQQFVKNQGVALAFRMAKESRTMAVQRNDVAAASFFQGKMNEAMGLSAGQTGNEMPPGQIGI